jgi:hypothetical protein
MESNNCFFYEYTLSNVTRAIMFLAFIEGFIKRDVHFKGSVNIPVRHNSHSCCK